jgi:feruloyl esterase
VQEVRICGSHTRDGYACITTDMGHKSTLSDNNWAANNLQGQVDFGYRATHVTTVVGKAIAEYYYGKAPSKSYFYGCSTGGRQAMIEAQRFPEDFDGIIAIAAANGALRPADADLIAKTFNAQTFNFDAEGKPILTIRKIPMIHRAVLAKCDMNDGLKDGLIGDPRDCKFDPADIQCKQGDGRECLTPAQVEIVRQLYKIKGMEPGGELNWINYYIREAPPGDQGGYIQSRGDPNVFPSLYNASNPDLTQFRDHGAKLIAAQGWSDPQISPKAMIDYFELATRTMGGPAEMAKFYRLFMIPGMDHCSGGEGAYGINYIAALENWVEKGQAPDMLIGVHPRLGAPLDFFNVDLPFLDPKDVVFSRPNFPYPKKAVYSGKGDANQAGSFVAR